MISENKKLILLVEDDAIISMSEKLSLEKCGYRIIIANNGKKAIELFKNNTDINLILMDIDLGKGIGGPETAITILKEREIPIVFLSNHNSPEMVEKTEKITSYGYVVKNSGIAVLDASIKMAFKLFDANKKITESKELYLGLINSTDNMIWSVDKNFNLITANTVFLDRTNLKLGDNVLEKSNYSSKTLALWKEFYSEVLSGKSIKRELSIPATKKNSAYWIEINLNPLFSGSEIISVVCFSSSIAWRKQAEEAIIISEERYRMMSDSANDAIITANSKGIIIDWNKGAEKIFGYTKKEISGQNLTKLMPEKYVEAHSTGIKRIEKGGEHHVINQNKPIELIGLRKNGDEFQIELSLTELVTSSEKLFTGTIRDISERKASEEKIKKLLIEKDLRLKEVHHRIKNNMSTIISLLSLEARTLKNPASKTALNHAGSRVRSMMVLYDKLYLSLDEETISVVNYLDTLVDEIIANFPNSKSVKVEKRIGDFILNVKKIQPIGIIINELLTNIMKYAFNDRIDGVIRISAKLKGDSVSIIVEDNGNGMPESIDFENSTGFGLTLIDMLTKQINGTIRIERKNGTKVVLEFERSY